MNTMRERIAKAINMTECSDGDPLGVALAENFRIEDGCESAAEVRAALDELLLRAADAVLDELMKPSMYMLSEMVATYEPFKKSVHEGMCDAFVAAIRAVKEGK